MPSSRFESAKARKLRKLDSEDGAATGAQYDPVAVEFLEAVEISHARGELAHVRFLLCH